LNLPLIPPRNNTEAKITVISTYRSEAALADLASAVFLSAMHPC